MKKIFINLFIVFCVYNILFSSKLVDTEFSQISDTSNVEYNGEVVKLQFNGVKSLPGNETKESVLDTDYPAFTSVYIVDPTVISENSIYKMWFHGSDGNSRIGYAYSSDGINWTIYSNQSETQGCTIDFGYPGFAELSLGSPSVLKDDSIYKMWFHGSDGNSRIGYAYSSDGINWTIYSNTLKTKGCVIDIGSFAFNSSSVADPTIIKDNNIYKMWFSGSDGITYRIGYAFSYNGTNWTIYSNTLTGLKGAVIGPENSPAFACSNTKEPTVIKDGNIYKMWFTGSDGINRIGYAFSFDGIKWTVISNESGTKGCFFNKGYPAFSSSGIQEPNVIKDNSLYKMWFSGNDGTLNARIGYSIITYYESGSFNSRIIDAEKLINLDKIYFSGNNNNNTAIKFQIRTGITLKKLYSASFTGPKNQIDTYYTESGEKIEYINDIQYIQYKAFYSTCDNTYSPELQMVTFEYNSLYEGETEDNRLYLFPNPYKPDDNSLSIRYSVNQSAEVEIKIFTQDGKEVWNKKTNVSSGWNITEWNGKDTSGKAMGSGVYLCVVIKKYPDSEKIVKTTVILIR